MAYVAAADVAAVVVAAADVAVADLTAGVAVAYRQAFFSVPCHRLPSQASLQPLQPVTWHILQV